MIRLLTINENDHDGSESYIYEQLKKNNISFFPVDRSIQLENKER